MRYELEAEVSELGRRLANILRFGKIAAIDHERALVRVESGRILTDWIPFFARHAGTTMGWSPPSAGEQCMLLSPDGELSSGCALTGIYSEENDQPSKEPDLALTRWPDNFEVSYDSQSHTLSLSRKDGLRVLVKATEILFETDKAEIKNRSCSLIQTLSEITEIVAGSKTPTMMGDRESIDNAIKLPPLKQKLDSFIG